MSMSDEAYDDYVQVVEDVIDIRLIDNAATEFREVLVENTDKITFSLD